jgi:hypothetical protein
MRALLVVATALCIAVSAGTTHARSVSYSGYWPATITGSTYLNGTHCIQLTDNGSQSWPHSGLAEMDGDMGGVFQVIGGNIMLYILDQGEYSSENLVFSANAHNGELGQGFVALLYSGISWDSGKVTFGANGGC